MKRLMRARLAALACALLLGVILTACGGAGNAAQRAPREDGADTETETGGGFAATYKVGICNYVENASLNQIVESIRARLGEIGAEKNVRFAISYHNGKASEAVLTRSITNFIADGVDLMVGVGTPVAVQMQAATKDSRIPVVFAAVSDPEGAKLVASNDAPGGNLTGTSDRLDTDAVLDLLFALNPQAAKIGLLYDRGQASSTGSIARAREYLQARRAGIVERTGATTDEIILAARALAADGVDAVFTPTDNTVMTAEMSIYETFSSAGIPHYAGADAFALNGAFLGYGVDYAKLGVETANMAADILLSGANPASTPVRTFDDRSAAINTETCAALGLDFDAVRETITPLCPQVQGIATAKFFTDLAG